MPSTKAQHATSTATLTAPPESRGVLLAALPRSQNEELRIALDEFDGHPYVSVRVWSQDRSGGWWPIKGKGVSIRLRELQDAALALREALEILEATQPE